MSRPQTRLNQLATAEHSRGNRSWRHQSDLNRVARRTFTLVLNAPHGLEMGRNPLNLVRWLPCRRSDHSSIPEQS